MVRNKDAERRALQRSSVVGGVSDEERVRTHPAVVAVASGRRTVNDVSSLLSATDSVTRSLMAGHLQREYGNGAVQRLMASTGPTAVQRDPKGGTLAPPSTPTTGDIAIVTGYLGRQVDNWHEGARQACEEFWKWSVPKPGAGRDFWLSLAGNVIWAVGASTTYGLVGIGIGALQTYISAETAKMKGESTKTIYDVFLAGFNKTRDTMMNEEKLEEFAKEALADAATLAAVREGRVKSWTSAVAAVAKPPDGESVDKVKRQVFSDMLKKYWDVNVSRVEVVYAAYQPTPMGINVALDGWPEVARLIRAGDVSWHIYKDKTIVGTKAGERTFIPLDHPLRDKVEGLVRTMEGEALKE